MKKILLATTVLAFTGSAFAATVSGKITAQYQKEDDEKTLKTEGEVLFSGSKTSSNGLTFGGTYKIKVENAQSTDDTLDVSLTPSVTSVSAANTAKTKQVLAADTSLASNFEEGQQTISQINTWISGSFGRVDMGRHATAARELGGKAFGVETADSRTTRGITYTTPTLSGFRAAYTWTANTKEEKSIGVGYSGTFSGVQVKVGWGNIKEDDKTETAWGLSAGMAGFTLEYGRGTDGDKKKFESIGGKYETGLFLVSYHSKKSPIDTDDSNKNTFLLAEYKVAEGLKVFAENNKEEGQKQTYVGTVINF